MKKNSGNCIELDIRCSTSTQVLSLLRTFTTSIAQQIGFSPHQVDEIEMAVDEACANVVRHAYKHIGVSPDLPRDLTDEAKCTLHVKVTGNNEGLSISVIDEGIGESCPYIGKIGTVEEFEARGGGGGLGTFIIHRFMDEVDYQYPEKGTMLVMKKYLHR